MHKETEKALVKKHVTESKAASKREREREGGRMRERHLEIVSVREGRVA